MRHTLSALLAVLAAIPATISEERLAVRRVLTAKIQAGLIDGTAPTLAPGTNVCQAEATDTAPGTGGLRVQSWLIAMQVVVGLFRDRGQAALARAAAPRRGMEVVAAGPLVEDAAGVHLMLRTSGPTEDARRMLLEYGAYSASVVADSA